VKYFFDIRLGDGIAADQEGVDFEILADALSAAHAEAAGLVADAKWSRENVRAMAVIVRDDLGHIITEVPVNWDVPFAQ